MDWFYNKTIQIVIDSAGTMDNGVYRKGEETTKRITCDVQPSGLSRSSADYADYVVSDYTVYCDPDIMIKQGREVIYNGNRYKIVKLVDWDSYYILYIKAVS